MIRKTEFKGKTLIFQDLYFNDFRRLLKRNNVNFKILNDGKREDGYTDYDTCTYNYEQTQKYAYSFKTFGFIDEDDEDRKSTRLNSSHSGQSRMPSSA